MSWPASCRNRSRPAAGPQNLRAKPSRRSGVSNGGCERRSCTPLGVRQYAEDRGCDRRGRRSDCEVHSLAPEAGGYILKAFLHKSVLRPDSRTHLKIVHFEEEQPGWHSGSALKLGIPIALLLQSWIRYCAKQARRRVSTTSRRTAMGMPSLDRPAWPR